jgi:hypothetical protein
MEDQSLDRSFFAAAMRFSKASANSVFSLRRFVSVLVEASITASVFPADGVLESISVTPKKVLATVCLTKIPVKLWPGKIVEYQSVMGWINGASETKFLIDYQTRLGFKS